MEHPRLQKKVGLFATVCLILIGGLMLAFSKRTSLFTPTYDITMRLKNVGGLRQSSSVFLAGIPVGFLESVELAPDGRSVLLHLRIRKQYKIHKDAQFMVEQIGVLGDEFVSIYPQENVAPLLQDRDRVDGKQSFSLQEVARSAEELVRGLVATLAEVREG